MFFFLNALTYESMCYAVAREMVEACLLPASWQWQNKGTKCQSLQKGFLRFLFKSNKTMHYELL